MFRFFYLYIISINLVNWNFIGVFDVLVVDLKRSNKRSFSVCGKWRRRKKRDVWAGLVLMSLLVFFHSKWFRVFNGKPTILSRQRYERSIFYNAEKHYAIYHYHSTINLFLSLWVLLLFCIFTAQLNGEFAWKAEGMSECERKSVSEYQHTEHSWEIVPSMFQVVITAWKRKKQKFCSIAIFTPW